MDYKEMWDDLKEIITEKFEDYEVKYGFDGGLRWVIKEMEELEEMQKQENEEIGENIRDQLEEDWLDEQER